MNSIFDFGLMSLRSGWSAALRRGRRALGDESGNAMIEFALVVIAFVPILLGTVGMAQVLLDSIEVSNAARAGASWAMSNSTSSSLNAGITAAAQAEAADFGTSLSVVPTVYWACSTALAGTQYSTLSAATTACTGGTNHPVELIQVSTSATLQVPFHVSGLPSGIKLPSSITLTGSAVTETE